MKNQKMKTQLNSVFRVIIPTLPDGEIIQKVRKQIHMLHRYIMDCDVRSEMYQYGRVEGMLYGFFAADRINMNDYEQFTYAVECMDNEFHGRNRLC